MSTSKIPCHDVTSITEIGLCWREGEKVIKGKAASSSYNHTDCHEFQTLVEWSASATSFPPSHTQCSICLNQLRLELPHQSLGSFQPHPPHYHPRRYHSPPAHRHFTKSHQAYQPFNHSHPAQPHFTRLQAYLLPLHSRRALQAQPITTIRGDALAQHHFSTHSGALGLLGLHHPHHRHPS